jgi:DNA-binding NarL/FixJ family response regulator
MAAILEPRVQTSILIVDDHSLVGETLRRVLDREPDLTVVAVVETAAAALEAAEGLRPDVVLMDYRLPDGDGATTAARLLEAIPGTKILMLTGSGDETTVSEALQAGCVGYLEKTAKVDRVITAIRQARDGELVVSATDLSRAVSTPPAAVRRRRPDGLTEREAEVLELLVEGLSNRDMADRLYVSVHTVRAHIRALLAKLGAHTRLEAVATARRQGLLDKQ